MSDLELPSGLVVRRVEQRLASFLEEEWLYYDAIADGTPNDITVTDVLAPIFVNAYFQRQRDTLRGIHRGLAGACNELLAKISVEADLRAIDAPMDELRELLAAAVAVRGVLIPVATKVLFRKRRGLIPILDNEIIRYYAWARCVTGPDIPLPGQQGVGSSGSGHDCPNGVSGRLDRRV